MEVFDRDSVPLICVTRSGVADTVHRGSVVVVDDAGAILFAQGGAETRAFIRSAAKPVQAVPVLTCGAADAFGLDDADVGIICGSHRGGDAQVAQVRSVLAKCGLSESLLQSGAGIADNCSGKHAGMLAACRREGLPLDTYLAPDHPHQLAILQTLSEVCCLAPGEVRVGVDGCGAPIHHFSIRKMALGYARMSVPGRHFGASIAAAIDRITRAMWLAPDGHTGEPLYRSVLGDAPRLLTKAGGSGVYCAGAVGRGIGFAMKVEDGASIPLLPVFTEVMTRVGVLSGGDATAVRDSFWRRIENRRGTPVGEIQILF